MLIIQMFVESDSVSFSMQSIELRIYIGYLCECMHSGLQTMCVYFVHALHLSILSLVALVLRVCIQYVFLYVVLCLHITYTVHGCKKQSGRPGNYWTKSHNSNAGLKWLTSVP